MKILHVSSAKSWRGGEQQIAYLLEELKMRGLSQKVFCPRNVPLANFCKRNNIAYTSYRKRFSVNPLVAKQLADLVAREHFDIVHLHDSHAHTFGCMAASFFGMKKPMVLHRRVDYEVGKSFLSRWKYNHSSIRVIICVSHFVKAVLGKAVEDHSKIKVVHSGIDMDRFAQNPKGKLRAAFNIPKDQFIVANVAAITEQKDYPTFVRTAKRLTAEQLPIHFFIIGDGKQRSEIEQLVAAKDLQSVVTFTGFRKDIISILPDVDVLLFTSRKEGLGTTLLDAQLCGVPIAATNVGGIPEIVKHGETGLLVGQGEDKTLAENVKLLLKNNKLRNQLTENAKQSVTKFSKAKVAQQIFETYQSILNT